MHTKNQRGFSLPETGILVAVSVLLLLSLHKTLASSFGSRRVSERTHKISTMATDLLGRLRDLPFGNPTDPPANAGQLSEFFDDDDRLGVLTLHQLRVGATARGHIFQIVSPDLSGTWRVKVSSRLNPEKINHVARDGREDLLRIEIYFDGQLQRDTLVAAQPSLTRADTEAFYRTNR